MMKKFVALLLVMLLAMPVVSLAETEVTPELPFGYRVQDLGDFTLPVPPNAYYYPCDRETEDGLVAEIIYLDSTGAAFSPYMVVWWFPNNMSAYFSRVHPLKYAKTLVNDVADNLRGEGCTVTDAKAVYGMRKGDVYYILGSMKITDGSIYAEGPHDLWVYQRWYGTYDMGTYYFEIYGPSRELVDAIVKDVEQVVFR